MSEPRETTKDVVIGDFTYQIRKMNARTGSWLAMQIMTKLLPGAMEGALQDELAGASTPLTSSRSEMTEAEFHNLQDHCLAVCYRYQMVGEMNTPMPILAGTRFAFADLEDDLLTVMALTFHSLLWTAKPFFEGDGFEKLVQSFRSMSLSNPSR